MSLGSLSEAIEWAEARWAGQRPVPIRLHRARATDGALGGPGFTFAFASALDGSTNETSAATRTAQCFHPLLRTQSARDCPECWGVGFKDVNVDRYRYPMSRALDRLANCLRPRKDRMPHPFATVMALAEHDWDIGPAARSLGLGRDAAEAQFLRSIRQLHRWYEEGPVGSTRYLDKSESQQNAENWTAA